MSLQRHGEEEERLLHQVGLADDLVGEGDDRRPAGRAFAAAAARPRRGSGRSRTPCRRRCGSRTMARTDAAPWSRSPRPCRKVASEGSGLADILLIGDAAIRQERVGEAGQRLEFDVGGHAAELRREHRAGAQLAHGRDRIRRDRDAGQLRRVPEGLAHHDDDVRLVGRHARRREAGDVADRVAPSRRPASARWPSAG